METTDISKFTKTELEALGYTIMKDIARQQQNLALIEQQLTRLDVTSKPEKSIKK